MPPGLKTGVLFTFIPSTSHYSLFPEEIEKNERKIDDLRLYEDLNESYIYGKKREIRINGFCSHEKKFLDLLKLIINFTSIYIISINCFKKGEKYPYNFSNGKNISVKDISRVVINYTMTPTKIKK